MPESFTEVGHADFAGVGIQRGKGPQGGDIVPVAVVLAEIAESLVRIEQNILVPAIGNALDMNGPALKSDHFVHRAPNFAARTQWNQRRIFAGRFLELLQDFELRILRIEN